MGSMIWVGGIRRVLTLTELIAENLLACVKCFKSLVHFEVNDGSRVIFWHDVWCRDRPSKTLFSNLFRMACLNYVTQTHNTRSSSLEW